MFSQIEAIRTAKEQRKLVLFVGAGVSQNSDLPSWADLIREFACELGYKAKKDCKGNEHFCSDEYLKIPQYLYNIDSEKYKNALGAIFGEAAMSRYSPNRIHKLLYALSPAHIITTNYDPLIELCDSSSGEYYTVASSDKDMLEKGGSAKKYILKMHGDYKDLDHVVLKEDDYLRYEQDHLIISTFIKALLVNHIFLFAGYSINDYNFKQIIDWIEYLSERIKADKDKMPTHFIVRTGDDPVADYDREYLRNKHIEIIEARTLPAEYVADVNESSGLTDPHGKQLYAVLNAVIDPKSDSALCGSFGAVAEKRLRVFIDNEINFIDSNSLMKAIRALGFKSAYEMQTAVHPEEDDQDLHAGIHILHIHDEKEYLIFEELCSQLPIVKEIFARADFFAASGNGKEIRFQADSTPNVEAEPSEAETLMQLYLNNDYFGLRQKLEDLADDRVKAYYNYMISSMDAMEATNQSLEQLKADNENKTIFWRFVDKLNWLASCSHWPNRDKQPMARDDVIDYFESLTESEQNVVSYLYDWFVNNKSSWLISECRDDLDKHIAYFDNPNTSSSSPLSHLFSIAGRVLCFYNYIKLNHVLMDGFKETNDLFRNYMKAVLYTYRHRTKPWLGLDRSTPAVIPPFRIDELTLDIIVKYSKYSDLNSYINAKRLSGFHYTKDCDVVQKFANLCASKDALLFGTFIDYFTCICCLLRRSELNDQDELKLIIALRVLGDGYLREVIRDDTRLRDVKYGIFALLASMKTKAAGEFISELIADDNAEAETENLVYYFDNCYNQSNKDVQSEIDARVKTRDNMFKIEDKIWFIVNDMLPMDDATKTNIIKNVNACVQFAQSPARSYPDHNKNFFFAITLLYLRGLIEDTSFLSPVKDRYPFIACILEPETFDVDEINYKESIWVDIFKNEKVRAALLNTGDNRDRIKARLIEILNSDTAGHYENLIYYGYFMKTTDESRTEY